MLTRGNNNNSISNNDITTYYKCDLIWDIILKLNHENRMYIILYLLTKLVYLLILTYNK